MMVRSWLAARAMADNNVTVSVGLVLLIVNRPLGRFPVAISTVWGLAPSRVMAFESWQQLTSVEVRLPATSMPPAPENPSPAAVNVKLPSISSVSVSEIVLPDPP